MPLHNCLSVPKTNCHEVAAAATADDEVAKQECEQKSGAYFYLADPSKFAAAAATAAVRAAPTEAAAATAAARAAPAEAVAADSPYGCFALSQCKKNPTAPTSALQMLTDKYLNMAITHLYRKASSTGKPPPDPSTSYRAAGYAYCCCTCSHYWLAVD